MIYEMRVYRVLLGRMPALLNRFQNTTLDLWKTRGFRPAGFWTTLIGPSNHALYYLIAWESLAEREKKWGTFQADQEWIAARAASEADGPILERVENYILQPTSFSSV